MKLSRRQLPPVFVAIIASAIGFFPWLAYLWHSSSVGYEPSSFLQKVLIGLGLFVAGLILEVSDRLGVLRTKSDLVELFPTQGETPQPATLDGVLRDAAAMALPAGIVAATKDLAADQATDTVGEAADAIISSISKP